MGGERLAARSVAELPAVAGIDPGKAAEYGEAIVSLVRAGTV